jgi:hypothetical protein
MKYLLIVLLNVHICVSFAQINLSQHTFSCTSNSFSNTSLKIDYTWGEMLAVSTISSPQFILTQGLHQPDKFTVGLNEKSSLFNSIAVYPNPFSDQITIDFEPFNPGELRFELRDACGRVVYASNALTAYPGKNQVSISTSNLASGFYLLQQIPLNSQSQYGSIPLIKH